MSEQQTLFDAERTIPVYCHVHGCQAIRMPGELMATACMVDAKRLLGIHARRPVQCLNHYDPASAPFPEGF